MKYRIAKHAYGNIDILYSDLSESQARLKINMLNGFATELLLSPVFDLSPAHGRLCEFVTDEGLTYYVEQQNNEP